MNTINKNIVLTVYQEEQLDEVKKMIEEYESFSFDYHRSEAYLLSDFSDEEFEKLVYGKKQYLLQRDIKQGDWVSLVRNNNEGIGHLAYAYGHCYEGTSYAEKDITKLDCSKVRRKGYPWNNNELDSLHVKEIKREGLVCFSGENCLPIEELRLSTKQEINKAQERKWFIDSAGRKPFEFKNGDVLVLNTDGEEKLYMFNHDKVSTNTIKKMFKNKQVVAFFPVGGRKNNNVEEVVN